MKLGQNDCFNEISHKFENRSCLVKNKVTRSNPRKTLVRLLALMKSQTSLEVGHVRVKTRSLGQSLEKPCVWA